MNYLQLALAAFKLINAIFEAVQQTKWYNDGRDAANAEAKAKEDERVRLADAARADADEFADGVRIDPRQRD